MYSFGVFGCALELIFVNLFALTCSQYVDDFTQIEPAAVMDARVCMESILDLLGWSYKQEVNKSLPFHSKFTALGVVFDFRQAECGILVISDKEERATAILQSLDEAVAAGYLPPPVASTLRGRLQYARSQTFGTCGAYGLRALAAFAAGKGPEALSLEALQAFWAAYFRCRRPRQVQIGCVERPILIFTDGAVEVGDQGKQVTIGAVLIEPNSLGSPEYFSAVVCREKVADWASAGTMHPVHQAELLPAAVALATWAGKVAAKRAILFLDNEAARGALIRGYSPLLASAEIVSGFWIAAAEAQVYCWLDRVASSGNPADGPSRFQQCRRHWHAVHPKVPEALGQHHLWLAT